jgi:hypothetical protein
MPGERDDLHRHHARGFPGALEEPVRRLAVSPARRVHVDDLPDLVDRPIQVDPPSGDLDVGSRPHASGRCLGRRNKPAYRSSTNPSSPPTAHPTASPSVSRTRVSRTAWYSQLGLNEYGALIARTPTEVWWDCATSRPMRMQLPQAVTARRRLDDQVGREGTHSTRGPRMTGNRMPVSVVCPILTNHCFCPDCQGKSGSSSAA